jgi:predicted nucleotidyltransferase
MKLFLRKNIVIENYSKLKTINLDEIDEIAKALPSTINSEIKIPQDVINSFEIKSNLNTEFWTDEKLNQEVKDSLLTIATDFFNGLELPSNVKIKDIVFTGSLANFNWSKFSDVDLHIVLDFGEIEGNDKLIQSFFDAQKNLWNLKHDITIHNFPVEIYVQDAKSKLHATAVYSIKNNKWILKPSKEELKINKNVIRTKALKFISKLKDIKKDYEAQNYSEVIKKSELLGKKIKNYRTSGLESGGEYSMENLVFKVLRRSPFMEILNDYKAKAYDAEQSLEEDMML